MTIKELRNYRAICAEIVQRERKIKRDKRHVAATVQSAAEFPYWKHDVVVEGDVWPYPVATERKKIEDLHRRRCAIEKFVEEIKDYRIRRAMELYFLEPSAERVTWEMVADEMGDGSTGNGLKQLCWKYMMKKRK